MNTLNTILVIDDDASTRMLLEAILEESGYDVRLADNGQKGIDEYCSSPTDLIITDLMMPEKNGLEMLLELRRSHPQVRIGCISVGTESYKKQFLPMVERLGASFVLSKPIEPKELLELVETALNAPPE